MVSLTVASAAFLSTCAISLAPNVILLFFPRYGEGQGGSSKMLSLGQAMSAGGLLGDVFLHTLPDHGRESDSGVWVLIGFTLFLMVDMVIRLLDPNSGHAHKDGLEANGNHDTTSATKGIPPKVLQSKVLLNLAADALHNFTDGLAIGASYAIYDDKAMSLGALLRSRGGLASVSILLHEVPHELGDFCTLVRAGYSKSQAVMAQFFTATAAFLGTAVALTVSSNSWAGERLLFITAGGFVYLAATTILPEVLEGGESFGYRFLQLAMFVVGILFLYLVAYLESEDEHGHHHHHHDHAMTHHQHHEHHQEL
jgi:solute carrier family 39 (zinc transporter), member 7